jgi:hypothetical protein
LRVPISNLDTTLLELSKRYYFLAHHRINAEDVTFSLIETQLKTNLFNKTSNRLEQSIDKKRAKSARNYPSRE